MKPSFATVTLQESYLIAYLRYPGGLPDGQTIDQWVRGTCPTVPQADADFTYPPQAAPLYLVKLPELRMPAL